MSDPRELQQQDVATTKGHARGQEGSDDMMHKPMKPIVIEVGHGRGYVTIEHRVLRHRTGLYVTFEADGRRASLLFTPATFVMSVRAMFTAAFAGGWALDLPQILRGWNPPPDEDVDVDVDVDEGAHDGPGLARAHAVRLGPFADGERAGTPVAARESAAAPAAPVRQPGVPPASFRRMQRGSR